MLRPIRPWVAPLRRALASMRPAPPPPAPPPDVIDENGYLNPPKIWPPLRFFPLIYFVEPSSICNAACLFCHYPQMRDAGKSNIVMPTENFPLILAAIDADCKARNITKVGVSLTPTTGEILTNRRWAEYARSVLEIGYVDWLDIVSNGILLGDADNIAKLAALPNRHKLNFSISIGGADQASYAEMFQVDRFAKVRKATNELCAYLHERRIILNISVRLQVADAAAIDQASLGAIFNEAGYPWLHFLINDHFKEVPVDTGNRARLKVVEEYAPRDYVPCGMLETGVFNFHAEGDISGCGCHYSQMPGNGSLNIGKLGDDWQTLTARRAEIIEAWRQRNELPKLCQKCQHYHTYEGLAPEMNLMNSQAVLDVAAAARPRRKTIPIVESSG